jgi:hypothetical protein
LNYIGHLRRCAAGHYKSGRMTAANLDIGMP